MGDNGDVFPDDDKWADSDGDGIGDNVDVDADGNGYSDCPIGTWKLKMAFVSCPMVVASHLILHQKSKADDYGAHRGETSMDRDI